MIYVNSGGVGSGWYISGIYDTPEEAAANLTGCHTTREHPDHERARLEEIAKPKTYIPGSHAGRDYPAARS